MLEILPGVDKQLILPYCKRAGLVYSEALYLYRAASGGETLAAALFEVGGDTVDILYYESGDAQDYHLFDAVVRAGLNYAANLGIATGRIPESFRDAHAACFSKLNYPAASAFDITNFFQKYKNCKGIES